MIPKLIKIENEEGWLQVTEYPDRTLMLEGIRVEPGNNKVYGHFGVRFSRAAVAVLIPLMQEWLEEGE